MNPAFCRLSILHGVAAASDVVPGLRSPGIRGVPDLRPGIAEVSRYRCQRGGRRSVLFPMPAWHFIIGWSADSICDDVNPFMLPFDFYLSLIGGPSIAFLSPRVPFCKGHATKVGSESSLRLLNLIPLRVDLIILL